ncbi:PQQ-binding-like beta-propeller repeat protein [Streptomyces sp. NPDC056749]|uniref:protein kinase domain-containing protein n=1 Tax=Streptomyces sp. NPDC056749 TaxID=3345936 RepID=UPI0036C85710
MIGPLPPGSRIRIGPYRLLGLLGAGGMGEVYLARADDAQVVPGAPLAGLVALKTVLAGLDLDDGFRIRFRREIAAAGTVRSPHSAALVAGDATGATPWLATEYVPGPSLAEAVARTGPLPEAVVRAVGSRLALALADMHAVRVLHRDLKPGNVLLGPDGPKVIDFGIAQAFEATQLTRTGVVVGSPGYISPEHVNGSRALVPASDVFCLGAVLAFAAGGRGPFDDSDMAAVIFRIANGEPELGSVPTGLRGVIERCLSRRAEDRPEPAELARLLLPADLPEPFPWNGGVEGQLVAHAAAASACAGAATGRADPGPVLSRVGPATYVPTAASGPPGRPDAGRRRRWPLLAGAAVVVCAVLGVVLAPGLLDGSEGTPAAGGGPATPGPTTSRAGTGGVVVPEADAGRTGDFGSRGADEDFRPAGWRPWKHEKKVAENGCVLADPVLVCSGGPGVTALDASSGEQRWTVPEPRGAATPGTAGHSIAAVEAGTVYAFMGDALVGLRLEDGKEVWRKALPDGYIGMGPVYADGVLHYVAQREGGSGGTLVAQQLTAARPEKWHRPYAEFAFTLTAVGGRLLATGSGVDVFDPETGEPQAWDAAVNTGCGHPVLTGEELLCSGEDGLTVLDLSDPSKRRTIAEGVPIRVRPALSRDGTVVVSTGEEAYAYRLADGEELWNTVEKYDVDIEISEVLISGDTVLFADGPGVHAYDVNASGGGRRETDSKYFDGPVAGESDVLAAGDVLFLSFTDGTVLSGFAP